MPVRADGNGNLFAWLGDPARGDAVLTGGHLDTYATGGHAAPGVRAAFLALDSLRAAGAAFRRPIGVAAFVDTRGERFGAPCLGSRLLTGALAPERAAALTDPDGVTLAQALGARPAGADRRLLSQLDAYLEVRPAPGPELSTIDTPIAMAGAVRPHGRWRLDFAPGADRAAATGDPMLTYAFTVLAANKEARLRGAHAAIGRVTVEPNATDTVASLVRGWLDVRAADEATLDALVEAVVAKARDRAGRDGTSLVVTPEARGAAVEFDRALLARIGAATARRTRVRVPVLTIDAAGDAGVLAAHVPTAVMLVRDRAGADDLAAGVAALAEALRELACD